MGDKHVYAAMREGGYILGGEQSGHIIQLGYATTGDGVLTGLHLLAAVNSTGIPVSAAAKLMTRYPRVLLNVRGDKDRAMADPAVAQAAAAAQARLGDAGRVLLRPSGTEPVIRVMVEARHSSWRRRSPGSSPMRSAGHDMIVGVGIDVVEIARFELALGRTEGLAARLFTDGERTLPPHSLAARFAAKEALRRRSAPRAASCGPMPRWSRTPGEGRTARMRHGRRGRGATRGRPLAPVAEPRRRHRLRRRHRRGRPPGRSRLGLGPPKIRPAVFGRRVAGRLGVMRDAYQVAKVRAAEARLMALVPDGALMQRAAAGLASVS